MKPIDHTDPKKRCSADADPVHTLQEAGKIAKQHPVTLVRRAKAGKLKILKLSARRRGIRDSELCRYLDEMETVT